MLRGLSGLRNEKVSFERGLDTKGVTNKHEVLSLPPPVFPKSEFLRVFKTSLYSWTEAEKDNIFLLSRMGNPTMLMAS